MVTMRWLDCQSSCFFHGAEHPVYPLPATRTRPPQPLAGNFDPRARNRWPRPPSGLIKLVGWLPSGDEPAASFFWRARTRASLNAKHVALDTGAVEGRPP